MSTARRRILVTSALPYATGSIHLGNLLEDIQSDIWVRFQRMRGHECWHVCADDAHGTGTMLRAEADGITPEELIERVRVQHAADFADFRVAHDNYYTTHSPENQRFATEIYLAAREAGAIRRGEVEQLYDPVKGLFLADRFVKGECPRCGAPDQYGDNCDVCSATYDALELKNPRSVYSDATPEVRASEHFFFDLPQFEEFLRRWTRSGTLQPEIANKLAEWLDGGLKPWDISRDAPYFGFEIPDAPGKYFYVWVDAPVGYKASFANFAARHPEIAFDDFWEPGHDTELHHFIGIDIINFHGLFWPAMLHCAGQRTPTKLHVHGMLEVDGTKMSKSKGTFILARTYLEHLDPDYLRYYFATKLSAGIDNMDLNFEDFVARVNSDLVGKVVNIASRCAGFIHKLGGGVLAESCHDPELFAEFTAAAEPIAELYEQCEYSRAMREITSLADRANQYIAAHAPWQMAKEPGREAEVAAVCTEGINLFRVVMTYLKPVVPGLAERAEAFLGGEPLTWASAGEFVTGVRIEKFRPLLARVDPAKIEAMIEASKVPEEAPEPPETPAVEPLRPEIGIDDFAKIDLRVARVVAADYVEGADKLLRLELDVGDHRREVLSGIRSAYRPEQLVGRLTVVVANLAPRKMRFGTSQGMVLAAGDGDEIFLVAPDAGARPGMQVT